MNSIDRNDASRDSTQPSDVATLLERERRSEWHRGIVAGRRLAIATLLDPRKPTALYQALEAICAELKLQRAAAESLGRQLDLVNGWRMQALKRVIELARLLDSVAPGWDKR